MTLERAIVGDLEYGNQLRLVKIENYICTKSVLDLY